MQPLEATPYPHQPPPLLPQHPIPKNYTMGSCISTCFHTEHTNPVPCPNPLVTPHTTQIVAHRVPHTHHVWAFNYRINLQPVVIGQRVALYRQEINDNEPDPDQATPVVEGWIGMVTGLNPPWVTFGIVDHAGVVIGRMCYPDYPIILLDAHSHPLSQPCPAKPA